MKRAPFFVAVLLIVGVLLPGTSGAATFTTIDVPGATLTAATDINDLGQIVGAFDDATGTHGFLIPEPSTLLLLGCGVVGLAGFGRKRLFMGRRLRSESKYQKAAMWVW